MVASVIRQYQEADLYRGAPVGDQYLMAIRRYFRIIEQKTVDQVSHDDHERPGLYWMQPEQAPLLPAGGLESA
jgi:hypothetical protein